MVEAGWGAESDAVNDAKSVAAAAVASATVPYTYGTATLLLRLLVASVTATAASSCSLSDMTWGCHPGCTAMFWRYGNGRIWK